MAKKKTTKKQVRKTLTNLDKYNWWVDRANELERKLPQCASPEKFRECLAKKQFAEAKVSFYLHLCRQGKSEIA